MTPGSRLKVHSCQNSSTYKYFVSPDRISEIWKALEDAFGEVEEVGVFSLRQISNTAFTLRASPMGNPITVIQSRDCAAEMLEQLHQILQFQNIDLEYE